MGRLNQVTLYGRVQKAPVVQKNKDTGEYIYGMVYIDTVRGLRPVGDDLKYTRHDYPLIISREQGILNEIAGWRENDIVYIKGVVTSKTIMKSSFCPNCQDETGKGTKNEVRGNLLYVTPIFAERVKDDYGDDKTAAKDDVVEHREISNQVSVLGTLIRDPKLFTTKKGLRITQYPIAINRKYTIRTDDPSIKTDWPIVKSYGEKALEDKIYLRYQAEIIVDGFLQARTLTRKVKCSCCGTIYEYKDHAMELVPYDIEYVSGNRSKEDVEAENQKTIEQLKQQLFNEGYKDTLDADLMSDDVAAEADGTN